jgi:hypothetical protein
MFWSRPRSPQSCEPSRGATPKRTRRAWIVACLILYLFAAPPLAGAQTITYVYDNWGGL